MLLHHVYDGIAVDCWTKGHLQRFLRSLHLSSGLFFGLVPFETALGLGRRMVMKLGSLIHCRLGLVDRVAVWQVVLGHAMKI